MNSTIYLIADLLRPNNAAHFHQAGNLRWLGKLLAGLSERGLAQLVNTADDFLSHSYEDLHQRWYGQDYAERLRAWAQLYDAAHLSPDMARVLQPVAGQTVVLFEGSPVILRTLTELNATWLDIRTHPIRCASDLFLSAHSNNAAIMQRLREFALSTDQLIALAKTRQVKLPQSLPHCQRIPDSAHVFLAQSSLDAALIADHKFINVLDHEPRLRQVVGHAPVFHKSHPYEVGSTNEKAWLSIFPNSSAIDVPTYDLLLLQPNCTYHSISSSAGTEAECFGAKVDFLSPNHRGLQSAYQSAYAHFSGPQVSTAFWAYVLGLQHAPDLDQVPRRPSADHLRRMIGIRWAA
jgi:hypothetical protein